MVALPYCDCFSSWGTPEEWREPEFHADEQDESCEAWQKLLAYIESIRRNGGEAFVRDDAVGSGYYDIVTLPKEIATLKTVKEICLYRSGISWLPPEIGEMESLEYFDVYTSYRLHWYPYEITRRKKLINSRMSTRTLYGNFKLKPPFPKLNGNPMRLFGPRPRCSICGRRRRMMIPGNIGFQSLSQRTACLCWPPFVPTHVWISSRCRVAMMNGLTGVC